MKAVLSRTIPTGRLVDLAHDLPAHGVAEAAFVLRAMAHGFPKGTVHLVVVDPGVGGRRAPIAIECRDGTFLVGPDNGVLYPLALELGVRSVHRIRRDARIARSRVGTTFDGRDLFAPAAARLADGDSPSRLGPAHVPHPYRIPSAARELGGARGEVVHVDHFGNLITNVPTAWLPARVARVAVAIGPRRARRLPLATSYEALGVGRAGVLGSSFGTLEVAVARRRADRRLGGRTGTPVRFAWSAARSGGVTVNSARPRRR